MPKIRFGSNRIYNDEPQYKELAPVSSKNGMPDWWKSANIFWLDEDNAPLMSKYNMDDEEERSLGFKACPALLDVFSTGYLLRSPVDIMFVQYNNEPYLIIDKNFQDFCDSRTDMPNFPVPHGYSKKHFHWWPNWGVETPKDYSILVTHPINRFDLPFLTVGGIIDSDRYTLPGLTPFFLKEGFSGLIPKGTPIAQIIPIKRENWESELHHYSKEEIIERHKYINDTFRVKGGGIYKRKVWFKKEYE